MTNQLLGKLEIPRDRATINAWCRSAYLLNPTVNTDIDYYATKIIAKLKNYNNIDFNIIISIVNQLLVIGECFVSRYNGTISILNPDYVNVQRSILTNVPIITLRPDENLRRLVKENRLEELKDVDSKIIECIKKDQNYPLSNDYIFHIAIKTSPYELRGTSILFPFLQKMIYKCDFSIFIYGSETAAILKDVFNTRCMWYASLVQDWIKHYNLKTSNTKLSLVQ